ncbi:MAG: hypothetical protein P8H56_11705, partial [Crocinitomicaceae bacterium]|nr:hypothetical protein [Crocinitomicaceae bacterium]
MNKSGADTTCFLSDIEALTTTSMTVRPALSVSRESAEDFYSESVRTDANGNYQFKGLTEGDYTIYALSLDTLSAGLTVMEVVVSASISDKKQVVSAP